MENLKVIRIVTGWTGKTKTELDIEGETLKECFRQFFKMTEKEKYCNNIQYNIKDQVQHQAYINFIRNLSINDYSKLGGDMW